MRIAITLLAAALALGAGCKKKEDTAASQGSGSAMMGSGSAEGSGSAMMGSGSAMAGSGSAMAGSGSAAAGSAAAGSGSSAKADVPTEQDFEAQANTAIDDKNVEAKVGQIEKDIGGQ